MTTTTTAISQQFLSQDSISHLVESSFEVLFQIMNNIEIELESILVKEFEQGLPNDLDNPL